MNETISLLKKLETRERDAVEKLAGLLDKVHQKYDRSRFNHTEWLAQQYLCVHDSDTRLDRLSPLGEDWGTWENAADGIPILCQLVTAPALIVDLYAETKKKFEDRYGVTPKQMRKLVTRGYVLLNVYEYDENWKNNEAKYAPHSWLDSFFQEDIQWCRINSIRRKSLFRRLGYDDYPDRIKEGQDLLRYSIGAMSDGDRKATTRNLTEQNALKAAAHRYAYVQFFGNRVQRDYIQSLFREGVPAGGEVEALLHLRSVKNLVASQITGCFGGIYSGNSARFQEEHSLQERAIPAIQLPTQQLISDELSRHRSEHALKEFYGAIAVLNLDLKSAKAEAGISIPKRLDEGQFENYLSFLKEMKNERLNMSNLFLEYCNSEKDIENRLHTAADYFTVYKELLEGFQRNKRLLALAQTSGTIVFSSLLTSPLRADSSSLPVAVGLIGGLVAMSATAMKQKFPWYSFNKNKCKLLGHFDKLERWQTRRS